MKINFTQTYRLWFLLTSISVLGTLITYFIGYDHQQYSWILPYQNIHTLFIGMLLAAVLTRIYMAVNKTNAVPLMHLIRAKDLLSVLIALFYIIMCSLLLITLITEIYLLSVLPVEPISSIHAIRDSTQPIFAIFVLIHVMHVLFINITKKRNSLSKLIHAKDS